MDRKVDRSEEVNLRPIPVTQGFITVEEFHEVRVNRQIRQEVYREVSQRQQTALNILEPQLAQKIAEYARQKGMTPEALINLWLSEKFAAETQPEA
ncbi:MAG: hypothetical protein HC827_04210 [Cyanobacteria bacterium RM1_2_2]|nr:hypothetical protein [Cyanobacteria bacterium RM1_2_2]